MKEAIERTCGFDHLESEDVVALHLIRELGRGVRSRWSAWISSLPESYDNLGLWSKETASLLASKYAISYAQKARKRVQAGYDRAQTVNLNIPVPRIKLDP